MESLQDQVKQVCDLADEVIKNPSCPIETTAKSLGIAGAVMTFLHGGLFIANPIIFAPLAGVLFFLKKKREAQEKERMLREIIKRQQAFIDRLSAENAENAAKIANFKKMLDMLNKIASEVNAA